MKHLDNYIDQILLYAMCITICITMYIYSVTMETGLVCILNTGAWLYNRFYVSVVKQPLALLWHCVWYSNLSRGNGMYFLWTVTNDYHPSDKKSSWQRLHHNRTAHIWSSIHIHYVCWGKMLRIGNDVILSIGQVSVFVHRKVFPILCYSFNDGLIRTSIQNSNEHHVVNDVTTMQLAPLLFSESLCWKKYFRGSFGHTGGRVFVVISSKNIAALPPHFVYTGSSKQSVMTWWVLQKLKDFLMKSLDEYANHWKHI